MSFFALPHPFPTPPHPTERNNSLTTMSKSIEMKSLKGSAVAASAAEDAADSERALFAVDTVFWKRVFR